MAEKPDAVDAVVRSLGQNPTFGQCRQAVAEHGQNAVRNALRYIGRLDLLVWL